MSSDEIAMPDSDAAPASGPSPALAPPSPSLLERAWRNLRGRTGVLAAVAVIFVVAGTVGSLLAAGAVAHNDATATRQTFHRTSTSIASALRVAVQREEDLAVSASTFYAGAPRASSAEFAKWAHWAQMLRHYPELDGLSLVALVRPAELAAFTAHVTGKSAPSPSPSTVPAGTGGSYHCLPGASLTRGPGGPPPADLDYCARTPTLLASRDSARSVYAPTRVGRAAALAIETPVYKGGQPPLTMMGRRAAFVGWLREVLVPGVVAREALRDYPGSALRLRYRTGTATTAAVTGGAKQPGAQSVTIALRGGWSARIFGPAAASDDITADGEALVLLIGGILLSLLLGLLVFLLGVRRTQAPASPSAPRAEAAEELYDPVTGLPNRALTLDLAGRMVARAQRQSGTLAGALIVDIDWFEDVNDKLGQLAGEQLMTVIAKRLDGVVRAGDTIGRLDGDELVVLVESAARGARLDSLAQRVMEALHRPVELDGFGPSFVLTANIGVSFGQYTSPEDLLRDAHLALQAGKAAGKDRYTMFNANMRSVIEGRGALEAELNTALLEEQFFLLYQPIYDLRSGETTGLEALIRWQHPSRGVVAPADFLPPAEETGLIVPIGRWVLEEACRRAAAWNVAGKRVWISVQISTRQLNRDGFVTDVRRALQQSGIEPSLLTLEITEATVLLDVTAATERIRELKQLGVSIAIDDFGSGYAYRSDLQQMPLDLLKVDRASLAASDDEDYRSWLLEAIMHFARDLSLRVIAKGIETEEQLATIQAMGCTMAQGMFTGEPIPTVAVESRLHAGFSTDVRAAARSDSGTVDTDDPSPMS